MSATTEAMPTPADLLALADANLPAPPKDEDYGVSQKRFYKCEVCFMTWDRGRDRSIPCPKCSRHPGKNTCVSCAGCASTDVNVWLKLDVLGTGSDAGREVRLCHPCATARRRCERERAEVADVTPPKPYALGGFVSTQVEANADAPLNGDAGGTWSPAPAVVVTDTGVKLADGGDVPAGLRVAHTCSKCKTTDVVPVGAADPKQMQCPHVFRFDPKHGARGAFACDCGLRVPAEALALTQKGHLSFSLKELAESFFVSDPRVLAIVNRVTESKPPTSREQRARAKPVCLVSDVPPESLPEIGAGCVVLPGSAKFEFIEPRGEIRKRRAAAFKIAWGRERALRHDAIRRAIFIWRGTPR
jgi:hypothetical protein